MDDFVKILDSIMENGHASVFRRQLDSQVDSSSDGCSSSEALILLSLSVGSSSGKRKSKKVTIALGVAFSIVSFFVLLAGIIYWRRQKRRRRYMMKVNGNPPLDWNMRKRIAI